MYDNFLFLNNISATFLLESTLATPTMECTGLFASFSEYIYPIINALLAISLIPVMYIYIKASVKNELQSTKLLFYNGLIFCIAIIINFISSAIRVSVSCEDTVVHQTINIISDVLSNVSLVITYFIYTAIIFLRLHTVVKETTFALSRKTVIIFTILYISSFSSCIISAALLNMLGDGFLFGIMMAVFGIFLLFSLIVWLLFLYIGKFIQIFREERQKKTGVNGDELTHMIAKISILFLISIITFFIHIGLVMLIFSIGSGHIILSSIVYHLWVDVDLYTNIACIFLSYQYFEPAYYKLCGCCQKRCHKFWMNFMDRSLLTDQERLAKEIASGNV